MKREILKKLKKIKMLVLDFDGVMTDNRVLIFENGREAVFCSRADGLGIEMLKREGIEVIVISKEKNSVVKARCKKLKIKYLNAINNKEVVLSNEIKKRGFKKEDICFIGNDINDLECIRMAGIGIAVADSHKAVLQSADYITKNKKKIGFMLFFGRPIPFFLEVLQLVICMRLLRNIRLRF